MAMWLRLFCMVFGLAIVVAALLGGSRRQLIVPLGGTFVGAIWFTFGLYGGLPLVDTVKEWRPAVSDQVDDMHLQGLLVMRRRRWMMWATIPFLFGITPLLIGQFGRIGQPELAILALGIPAALVNLRYQLSRCPRCGYGYFAASPNRAAFLWTRKACAHCGLSLTAYKNG